MDLPKTVEAYYQETGRAGRDGLPSTALLLYSLADIVALKQMMESSQSNEAQKMLEQRKLTALLGICETSECRRRALLRYFGDTLAAACMNCDNCLTPPTTWDGTVAAQKALSAVYRTGQRFGAAYIAAVLRGESDERVVRFGHDQLSVFGVGTDLDAKEWMSIIRQLVSMGYLAVDMTGYGGLSLSPSAQQILRGDLSIHFRKEIRTERSRVTKKAITASRSEKPTDAQSALFERLRSQRLAIAKESNVPPYVVFHDTTLLEMASKQPQSLEELRQITGVGEKKIAKYGEQFLAVLIRQA